MDKLGEMPLPPYITHKLQDKNMYQTVYAKFEGSAAAPTAGLHFTDELLEKIKAKGVDMAFVTLHVGLGTFRPVKVTNVKEHHMHTEWYQVREEDADKMNRAKKNGHRVICVGTTSCRTVEGTSNSEGKVYRYGIPYLFILVSHITLKFPIIRECLNAGIFTNSERTSLCGVTTLCLFLSRGTSKRQ